MGPAVALWLGLAAGAGLGVGAAVAALVAAAACAWLAGRSPDRVGTLALLLALGLAGAARGAGHRARLASERAWIGETDRPWRLSARVVAPPARESGEPEAIVAIEGASPPLPRGTRARLWLPPGSPAEWGDRVRLIARLEVPAAIRNPGGFDARSAADAAGLAASGRAYACGVVAARGLEGLPRATLARWRRAIEGALDAHLSPAARELVTPLVIGDQSALSSELNASFRASGLVHLLALSGLHVAWLAALARGLAASLGGGLVARAVAAALCALGYAGIAGPLPSLMRAAATELVASAGRLRGRALEPVQALALSALVLLAAAPGWAADLGFQLSCVATLGLVTAGPWLAGRRGVARAALSLAGPTLSAQVMALPILLERFHAFSWTGAIANLAAVPVSGLLLAAAWIATLLELAVPGLGTLLFGACETLSAVLRWIAMRAGGMPGALVSAGHDPLATGCAAGGAVLLALSLPGERTIDARDRPAARAVVAARLAGALLVAVACLLALTARPLVPPPGRSWLVALDVGQGDALALGDDRGWRLVDAGPRSQQYDAGERVVLPFLRWAGVSRLEAVFLTHDDSDHVGGAAAVARGVRVGRWWAPPSYPGLPGPGPRFGAAPAARGDTLVLDPPLIVRWPPDAGAAASAFARLGPLVTSADNRAGLVLELGEGAGRALLLADVDSTVEAALEFEPGLAVIKVAHHGSASSSGESFLARARGRHALVSAGRRNAFGHPAAATLARLTAAGLEIHRTDRSGALWFELSAGGARRLDWRCRPPGADRAEGPRVAPLRVPAGPHPRE